MTTNADKCQHFETCHHSSSFVAVCRHFGGPMLRFVSISILRSTVNRTRTSSSLRATSCGHARELERPGVPDASTRGTRPGRCRRSMRLTGKRTYIDHLGNKVKCRGAHANRGLTPGGQTPDRGFLLRFATGLVRLRLSFLFLPGILGARGSIGSFFCRRPRARRALAGAAAELECRRTPEDSYRTEGRSSGSTRKRSPVRAQAMNRSIYVS
jgi:hypothetical protein